MDILRTKLDITHSITVEEASSLIPVLETSIDSLNERYVKGSRLSIRASGLQIRFL